MDFKYITKVIMFTGIAVWAAWDVVPALSPQKGDTISEITAAASHLAPVIPFLVGILCGHLFGESEWVRPYVVFIRANPLVPLLVGIVCGLFFWSQTAYKL
jgi:hypothetical protein